MISKEYHEYKYKTYHTLYHSTDQCCCTGKMCIRDRNLPGDDLDDSIETAKILSALPVQIVKAHSLYIAKNTKLCEAYENGTISLCKKEEYLNRLILFLEYLRPDIAIERLFSQMCIRDRYITI